MKKIFFAALIVIIISSQGIFPAPSSALSYQPSFRLIPNKFSTVVKGGTVHVFHSGTHDVTNTVRNGDIFVVYRIDSSCKMTEVGRIRFITFVGETYMEAEVIEGELKAGDIAKKGNISGLLVATEPCAQ